MFVLGWMQVIESWEHVGQAGLPLCRLANPDIAPPEWWHHKGEPAGKQAWQRLVSKHQLYQKRMASSKSDDDDDDDDNTPAKRRSSKGKGQAKSELAKPPRHKRSAMTAQSPASALAKTSGQPRARTSKSAVPPAQRRRSRAADYVEIDPSDVGESSESQCGAMRQVSEKDEQAARPPSAKRSRMLTVDELAAQPSDAQPVNLSHRQTPREQLQEDAPPGYSPGPNLQTVNALPASQVVINPGVQLTELSSSIEQGQSVVPGCHVFIHALTFFTNQMLYLKFQCQVRARNWFGRFGKCLSVSLRLRSNRLRALIH
jgi:hypothetical protein